MNGDEVKAYVYLLAESWLETPRATLPNDDNDLSLMAKLPMEKWMRVKPRVMANFILRDNRWINEKLAGVSDTQKKFQEWGKKGGNPNLEPKQVNPTLNPTLKPLVNLATSTATASYTEPEYPDDFLEVWRVYPNKRGKNEGFKAWRKIKPSPELKAMIIKAIGIQRKWPQWVKDGGQFIPHFSRWMNQMMWQDEGLQIIEQQPTNPDGSQQASKSSWN